MDCELCNNKTYDMELNGDKLIIQTSQWDDYYDDFITKEFEINYCPMCGRKLKEECND